ncbi:hypothetical protein Purlil1_5230 [Purpureocillium lilacinum]|uniref:Peptidase M14 domain-containing protein n=1 Tax=Purpureocillium lilacinum TaxID=33203 RepID=A0ABR0C4D7_PURLI|nr:hypothetical protein Purlil1_5230 [Purpureocillium lilacinum]
MKSLAALSTLLAVTAAAVPQPTPTKASYDGHKVFRVMVGSKPQRVSDVVDRLGLSFWQHPTRKGAFADIEVPPARVDEFRQEMEGLELITMHEDLGKSIADEGAFHIYAEGSANSTWFNSYHPYNDHLQFINDLASKNPSNAEVVTSGKSLQGNAITGIHFWGSAGKGKKPAIVLHGTVHAREWIASMVVEYFADTLVNGYKTDNGIKALVDKYDFYLFPIVNPDGFKYTQASDRMWRKNRQTTAGSSCLGHDINRNWPYKWEGPGSSTNPCAQDFRGASAGDAPETKALSDFLKQVKSAQGLKLYIDYHSYSQLFMTPYGYTCNGVPPNNNELQSLAGGAVAAIRQVHGLNFDYGPICTTIYQAAGSSVDYVADVVKADYTFTSELRDTGRYGFVLPPDQIVPSGEEAFAGFKYLLQNMK